MRVVVWGYLKELPAALQLVVFGSEVERVETCRGSQGHRLRLSDPVGQKQNRDVRIPAASGRDRSALWVRRTERQSA